MITWHTDRDRLVGFLRRGDGTGTIEISLRVYGRPFVNVEAWRRGVQIVAAFYRGPDGRDKHTLLLHARSVVELLLGGAK